MALLPQRACDEEPMTSKVDSLATASSAFDRLPFWTVLSGSSRMQLCFYEASPCISRSSPGRSDFLSKSPGFCQ